MEPTNIQISRHQKSKFASNIPRLFFRIGISIVILLDVQFKFTESFLTFSKKHPDKKTTHSAEPTLLWSSTACVGLLQQTSSSLLVS